MQNRKTSIAILAAAAFLFLFAGTASSASLVAPGSEVTLVKSGYQGTEGPAADAEGNIYFTEKAGNSIQKWSWRDGKISSYKVLEGGAIGMMFDAQGQLIACCFDGTVTRDNLKGNIAVIADSCDGKKLHIPNDLWIDSKGGIYFSDFAFLGMGPGGPPGEDGDAGGMPGAQAESEEGRGMGGSPTGGFPGMSASEDTTVDDLGICYIAPDGKSVTRVLSGINPNGLIGTPDGKILYTTGEGGLCAYTIHSDGSLSDPKLFCTESTDGIAMDEQNNVYLIGDQISIYNPKGGKIEEIPLPEEKCKNMTFGGKDRKTLFITGNSGVYTLEMTVRGASAPLDIVSLKK
jgi:gluconolactonase